MKGSTFFFQNWDLNYFLPIFFCEVILIRLDKLNVCISYYKKRCICPTIYTFTNLPICYGQIWRSNSYLGRFEQKSIVFSIYQQNQNFLPEPVTRIKCWFFLSISQTIHAAPTKTRWLDCITVEKWKELVTDFHWPGE